LFTKITYKTKLFIIQIRNNVITIKGCDPNFEVNILVLVIIVFKCYPNTYCLMQRSCFICSDF